MSTKFITRWAGGLFLLLTTLGFFACEKDANLTEPGTDRIKLRDIVLEEECKNVCDGMILDFSELNEFDLVTTYKEVAIRAWDRKDVSKSLQVRVFDTVDPDRCDFFNDDDLVFGEDSPFGNVLIIQEGLNGDCANDRSRGGVMQFDFSAYETVTINCLDLLDTEERAFIDGQRVSGEIRLYDADGMTIGSIFIPAINDGEAQVVEVGVSGVAAMEMEFLGSGAISNICVTPDDNDPGCTYTQGRWKNKQVRDNAWCEPFDKSFDSWDGGWLDILKTPTRGNAYYILAHQYIAAYLNVNCLDADTDDIAEEFALAGEWLNAYTPENWPASTRPTAIRLSEVLDDFNNGRIGPGHCEKQDDGEMDNYEEEEKEEMKKKEKKKEEKKKKKG